jgi:transposase
MTKATRAQYTLEFKQEAVRMVEFGQSIAAAARRLGAANPDDRSFRARSAI